MTVESAVSWLSATAAQHLHVYTSMYSNFRSFYANEELGNTWQDLQMLSRPKLSSVLFVLLGAVVWTAVRYVVELFLLKVSVAVCTSDRPSLCPVRPIPPSVRPSLHILLFCIDGRVI